MKAMNTTEMTKWLMALARREGYPGFKRRGFSLEAYHSILRLLAIDGINLSETLRI